MFRENLHLIFIGVTSIRPYFVSFCVRVYILLSLCCWRCYCIIISDDLVIGHFAVNSARTQELNCYYYRLHYYYYYYYYYACYHLYVGYLQSYT
jgi:hypothetical protein